MNYSLTVAPFFDLGFKYRFSKADEFDPRSFGFGVDFSIGAMFLSYEATGETNVNVPKSVSNTVSYVSTGISLYF